MRFVFAIGAGFVFAVAACVALPGFASAQAAPNDRALVLAVADSALAAISRGDMVAFTDLMIPEAIVMPVRGGDSARYSVRARADERARKLTGVITERGFRPEARISGPLAVVWLPYDLYIDGNWSHCGVDVFTLVRTAGKWKIATAAWTIEQPPACQRHPAGPPAKQSLREERR